MAAVRKIHTHDGVAGVKEGKIDGKVCLCARMRLYVCMLGAEKLLKTVAGDILNDINAFTAAVIALARISFGILIRKMTAHSCHDGFGYKVFRCNKLDMRALTLELFFHRFRDITVRLTDQIKLNHFCFPPIIEVGYIIINQFRIYNIMRPILRTI